MSTSVSSVASHFPSAENGFSTTTSGSVSSGATTVGLNSVSGYTNGEVVVFVIDPDDDTKKQTFTGTMDTSGSQVTSVVWTAGSNQTHSAGATIVDYATATHISMISKGLLVAHNQSGTHKADMVLTTPKVDTINEETGAAGVTIDGLLIKDSKLATNNSVVAANITNNVVGTGKMDFTNGIVVGATTGGPTSGTTVLELGSVTIPAQATACYIDASAYITMSNDTTNDEFTLHIREGAGIAGTILGQVRNRHSGGTNQRMAYTLAGIHDDASATSPYLLAASTSLVLTATIVRSGGSGTATSTIDGVIKAVVYGHA